MAGIFAACQQSRRDVNLRKYKYRNRPKPITRPFATKLSVALAASAENARGSHVLSAISRVYSPQWHCNAKPLRTIRSFFLPSFQRGRWTSLPSPADIYHVGTWPKRIPGPLPPIHHFFIVDLSRWRRWSHNRTTGRGKEQEQRMMYSNCLSRKSTALSTLQI